MIYIVGLGPNEKGSIKEDIKKFLLDNKGETYIARIEEHPAVDFLKDNGITYETCDRFYVDSDNFSETYNNIANYVLEKGKSGHVVYMVPGHPMVAELTTKLILSATNDVIIIGGESFLDSCFNAAQFDPVEGFSLLDATDPDAFKNINPKQHLLITQCYDDIRAADISVELDRYYPYDHEITIMEQVGCEDEKIYRSELAELSFAVGEEVNNLRTIYIPPFEDAVDTNIKNYVADFEAAKDSKTLLSSIEESIKSIKSHSEDDEKVTEDLAKILQDVLDFTVAEDMYIEIDDVLRKMKNNG